MVISVCWTVASSSYTTIGWWYSLSNKSTHAHPYNYASPHQFSYHGMLFDVRACDINNQNGNFVSHFIAFGGYNQTIWLFVMYLFKSKLYFCVYLNSHTLTMAEEEKTPLYANCFCVICPHCLRLCEREWKKKVLIFLFTFPKFFLRVNFQTEREREREKKEKKGKKAEW